MLCFSGGFHRPVYYLLQKDLGFACLALYQLNCDITASRHFPYDLPARGLVYPLATGDLLASFLLHPGKPAYLLRPAWMHPPRTGPATSDKLPVGVFGCLASLRERRAARS